MPFLIYRDNDSGLRPSFYSFILGRVLNHYKIKPAVSICILTNNHHWPQGWLNPPPLKKLKKFNIQTQIKGTNF